MLATWLLELHLDRLNRLLLEDAGRHGVEDSGSQDVFVCWRSSMGSRIPGLLYLSLSLHYVHNYHYALLSLAYPLLLHTQDICNCAPSTTPHIPPNTHLPPESEYLQVAGRLRSFLTRWVGVLDAGVTSAMLGSYGRIEELMHVAALRNDYESLLEYLVQKVVVVVWWL